MYKIYEVKAGETVNSIANKLNISPDELNQINGFNQNTTLMPGTYIIIPSTQTTFEKYIVQKGDSIYSIAQKYNTDYNQLLKLNGLNQNDYIYPNQEIYIPARGTKFYITKQQDSLNSVSNNLQTNPQSILDQNQEMYLMPDQLIVYRQN